MQETDLDILLENNIECREQVLLQVGDFGDICCCRVPDETRH